MTAYDEIYPASNSTGTFKLEGPFEVAEEYLRAHDNLTAARRAFNSVVPYIHEIKQEYDPRDHTPEEQQLIDHAIAIAMGREARNAEIMPTKYAVEEA